MMEYPLAERELRRLAQRPLTFLSRSILAIVVSPILALFFLLGTASGGQATQADEIATTLYVAGTLYLFVVSVLLPPFLTSGLIAAEKHERTLGTLLIADFSASDVILSKFVPTLIEIELLVFGSLPVLAFATVLGGITPGDLVLSVFLFSLSALLVASMGLFASTVSRQPGGAMMATITLLAIPLAVDLTQAGQVFGGPELSVPVLMSAVAASQVNAMPEPGFWIPSALIALGASTVLVSASIVLLPRQIYSERIRIPGRLARAIRRPVNPFLRERGTALVFSRAAGGLSSAVRSISLKILFSFALSLVAFMPCVGLLFVAGVVMFDVVSTMDNAKRSGVLDDIRLSAPDPTTFLWDIYYALWMRGWFYIPGVVIGSFSTGSIFTGGLALLFSGDLSTAEYVYYAVGAIVASLAVGMAQMAVMTAIGCYQSGYGRNTRVQTLISVTLYSVVILVSIFGIAIVYMIAGAIGTVAIASGTKTEAIVIAAILVATSVAVLSIWTVGFYSSYRARHLKYV